MKAKTLILFLNALIIGSLIFVVWAMSRVSTWIVLHDPVWGQMDKEGAKTEHALAEIFLQAKGFFVLPIIVIFGIGFLWLLRSVLFGRTNK